MMKHDYVEPKNTGNSPWMMVSILLGVLLMVSFGTNLFVISKVNAPGQPTPSGTGQYAPPQAAPSAPNAPSGPAQRVQVSVGDDPALGNKNAKVTIIEFSDFQCPFCKRFHDATWTQLKSTYIDSGKVYFVYRDFPLSFHQNAEKAAEAANCANEQGKFWEYHDIIFKNSQGDGTGLADADLKKYATDLSLDTAKFNTCLDTGKYKAEVSKDQADGSAAGVSGTPSFFINGIQLVGAQPFAAFQQTIDAELAK